MLLTCELLALNSQPAALRVFMLSVLLSGELLVSKPSEVIVVVL